MQTLVFENSFPSNHCFSKTKDSEATASFTSEDRPRPTKRKSGGAGGYRYCVLGCYSNEKKQKGLSFHVFPAGKSKEKDCYVEGGTLCIKKRFCANIRP